MTGGYVYEAYGFKYDDKLTQELKHIGAKEKANHTLFPPNDEEYNAQHVWTSMKVFINPAVAALPQHAHLFGEFGCFGGKIGVSRECKNAEKETLLDPSFYPLNLTIAQDEAWYDIVKANIKQKPKKWDVTTVLLLREREKKNIDNYQLED